MTMLQNITRRSPLAGIIPLVLSPLISLIRAIVRGWVVIIVSRGQTTNFLQGVIACSISACKNRVWYGSQARLILDTYKIL